MIVCKVQRQKGQTNKNLRAQQLVGGCVRAKRSSSAPRLVPVPDGVAAPIGTAPRGVPRVRRARVSHEPAAEAAAKKNDLAEDLHRAVKRDGDSPLHRTDPERLMRD